MVALGQPLGLPFNGALVSGPPAAADHPHKDGGPAGSRRGSGRASSSGGQRPSSGGGGGGGSGGGSGGGGGEAAAQQPCAISWLARDSSKPGRQLPPGVAEAWVVHASPEWSNARAGAVREAAAQELLSEFLRAAGAAARGVGEGDVAYLEAHAWTNA
jgi:hypothetical protein